MTSEASAAIDGYIPAVGADRTRLLDIVEEVQHRFGYVSDDAVQAIATGLGIHAVEVED
jgi:NADH:ubiquinone oxidoreductase subunit E